jgi:hypothetical protein
MDTMRGILFLVVTLIIIVSIYYIVKMVKGRTPSQSPPSPSPSPSDQTGKISISDLKFERTLNPDKSNSKGDDDIVGYTIEYDEGINYKELSTNVTFTLKWKNNIGFTGNVVGFTIEHYVKGDDNGTYGEDPKQSIELVDPGVVNVNNFESNEVSIKGNGEYSVVGENRFKISVIMNDNTKTELYDGTKQNDDSHGIKISKDELGATLSMTKPETVKYIPVTREFASTSVDIKKTKYQIHNPVRSLSLGRTFIYLIPAFPKNVMGEKVVDVETFFFKYGDGDYLLEDLKKGAWNEKTSRERNVDFDNTKHDNRMFVSFYDKSKDTDGNVTAQLRYTKMGYGTGTVAITTDENGKLELMDISDTDTVSETRFNNLVWTFHEYDGTAEISEPTCTTSFIIEQKNGISALYLATIVRDVYSNKVSIVDWVNWLSYLQLSNDEIDPYNIDVFESEDGTPLYGITHYGVHGKYVIPNEDATDYKEWSIVEKSNTYNLSTWKKLLEKDIYSKMKLHCRTTESDELLGSISSELISLFESYAGIKIKK